MSAEAFSNVGEESYALAYQIYFEGGFYAGNVDSEGAVFPVITLKANISPSSGDGTEQTPYVID